MKKTKLLDAKTRSFQMKTAGFGSEWQDSNLRHPAPKCPHGVDNGHFVAILCGIRSNGICSPALFRSVVSIVLFPQLGTSLGHKPAKTQRFTAVSRIWISRTNDFFTEERRMTQQWHLPKAATTLCATQTHASHLCGSRFGSKFCIFLSHVRFFRVQNLRRWNKEKAISQPSS